MSSQIDLTCGTDVWSTVLENWVIVETSHVGKFQHFSFLVVKKGDCFRFFCLFFGYFWPEMWVLFEFSAFSDKFFWKSQRPTTANISTRILILFISLRRFRSWSEKTLKLLVSDRPFSLNSSVQVIVDNFTERPNTVF